LQFGKRENVWNESLSQVNKSRFAKCEGIEKSMNSTTPDMEEIMGEIPMVTSNVSLLFYEIPPFQEMESHRSCSTSIGSFLIGPAFLENSAGSQSFSIRS
jgi:archaellum component FlaC